MMGANHVQSLRVDTERLAATMSPTTSSLPVRARPGWDLRRLVEHVGHVHRWALAVVESGSTPDPACIESPPADVNVLAAWFEEGGDRQADRLETVDPDAATWHPFPAPLVASVWQRRQAQETSVHRWDAQAAVGAPGPIDPLVAADGVDEYFAVMLPRLLVRSGRAFEDRDATVEFAATDVRAGPRRWRVGTADGSVAAQTTPPSRPPAAVVSGSAEDLLLGLWARRNPLDVLDVEGDPVSARTCLDLGGN